MSTMQPSPCRTASEAGPFRFLGVPTLMRATADSTNGAFGLMEHQEMPAGFASPYHTHHREDESFYVMEGEIAFVCGGQWQKAGPGTFVYGPREVPHGFKVLGPSPARMLLLCTPGGFEQFVLEQTTPIADPPSPPDMGRLMMLAAKYGIEIHGPLPAEPDDFARESAADDLKSLNQRWLRAFNDRDWQAERAARGENFRAHLSGIAQPLDDAAWSGFLQAFVAAFPDSRIATESCISEGDTVVTRWTLTGTHQGPFQGIAATGRAVRFAGLEWNRVVNGRIVEHWSLFDNLALLRQIGALPE